MSNLLEKAKQQPDKAPRSILDPHYEVIATLRKKHWTFREIADFFKKEGIEVSVTWLTQYWTIKNGPSKKSSPPKKHSGSKKDSAYEKNDQNSKTENGAATQSAANSSEKTKLFEYTGLYD